jgi:hypothetical protein
VFSTYPAYNEKLAPGLQGFNLLTADGRLAAIEALVQIRHNIICACSKLVEEST